jgi:thiol:disulfide interchange protein
MQTQIITLLLAMAMLSMVSGFMRSPMSALSGLKQSLMRRNYKTFDEFLNNQELPVLVDFYAEW